MVERPHSVFYMPVEPAAMYAGMNTFDYSVFSAIHFVFMAAWNRFIRNSSIVPLMVQCIF